MKTIADYNTIKQILFVLNSEPQRLVLTSKQCKELRCLLKGTEGDYIPTDIEIETYSRDRRTIDGLNFNDNKDLVLPILRRISDFENKYC